MTAPNLVNPGSIVGKTTYLTLADTNETALLTNSADSSKAMRITNLMAVNVDGTSSVDVTTKIYNDAVAGTGYPIASTINVPADSAIVILSRDNHIWLEEDRRITVEASASGDLSFICSYEEVSA
jgi:hypothetical protein